MSTASIGAMRYRVTLESPALTADGGGGGTQSWTAVTDLWAAIVPTSGDERQLAESIRGHVSHTITIRHRSAVTPAVRIRFGTRIFEILAVLETGTPQRRLHCYCRERDL